MARLAGLKPASYFLPRVSGSQRGLDDLVSRLKSRRHEVAAVRVDVEQDEAARRMIARYKSTGRLISLAYFRSIGDRPKQAYDALNKEGIRHAEIDLNGPKGTVAPLSGEPGFVSLLYERGFRPGQVRDGGAGPAVRERQAATGREGQGGQGQGLDPRTYAAEQLQKSALAKQPKLSQRA